MTTDVTREDGVHKESKQFGFVSFNNPKDAAEIVLRYNNEDLEFNNKQLYVNYYEDKSTRKKRLATKKDNFMGMFDPAMFNAQGGDQSNIMEYFMQIFQQYIKSYTNTQGGGYAYNNYGHQQYPSTGYGQGYNQHRRTGQRPHRGGYPHASSYGYQNQPHMYGRPPRQEAHHSYATAAASIPHSVPPPAAPAHLIAQMPPAQMPPAPLPSQPRPPVNTQSQIYVQTVKSVFATEEFKVMSEEARREKIGEEIYNYVLQKAGEESAPKITGMIIDLPYQDLITSVQSYEGLQEKIQEGLDLLKDDQ